MTDLQPPKPRPTALTQAYWDALDRGEIVIQRCGSCSRFQHPPLPVCTGCAGEQLEWRPVDRRGTILQHTAIAEPRVRGLAHHRPLVCVLVEMREQRSLRILGNLRESPGAIRIGDPVRMVVVRTGTFALAQFELDSDAMGVERNVHA